LIIFRASLADTANGSKPQEVEMGSSNLANSNFGSLTSGSHHIWVYLSVTKSQKKSGSQGKASGGCGARLGLEWKKWPNKNNRRKKPTDNWPRVILWVSFTISVLEGHFPYRKHILFTEFCGIFLERLLV
jgi:hypothetical protein